MGESGDVHVEQHHQPNQSPYNKECRANDAIAATKREPAPALAIAKAFTPKEHFHEVKVAEEAAIHTANKHTLEHDQNFAGNCKLKVPVHSHRKIFEAVR